MHLLPPFDPTPAHLAALAVQAELGRIMDAELVKRHNDIWRLHTSAGGFYLKAYTKAWYGDDLAATGGCVEREVTAHRLLAGLGLPGPEVRWASSGPRRLGRPALLLRELGGQPLTRALAEHPAEASGLLGAVGAYLAHMHARTFRFPGPLDQPGGPTSAPDPRAYQHPYWSPQMMARSALADLERARLPHALAAEVARRLDDLIELTPARGLFTATATPTSCSWSAPGPAGRSPGCSIWRWPRPASRVPT